MPGKGKGNGKGKEAVKTVPAPPSPAASPKWDGESDQALLNIILRLGEFHIRNWDAIYREFHEVQRFPNTRNSCQTRWSRTLRDEFHTRVRYLDRSDYDIPQQATHHEVMSASTDSNPEREDIAYAESSQSRPKRVISVSDGFGGGSQHGRHAYPASSVPAILPRTNPHNRLFSVPEEGENTTTAGSSSRHGRHASSSSAPPAFSGSSHSSLPPVPPPVPDNNNAANTPTLLYDMHGHYMGKIAVKDGFRTIEIKDTFNISLPMATPGMNQTRQYQQEEPDDYLFNAYNGATFGLDDFPLFPEAHQFDIEPLIEAGAFGSARDEEQME
ncbi:hypothetical protein PG993_007993 [Apiospora rasikravindrae]|uniref:Myb-like domain-containing protein n=1 Tax=Apiospora rasikravindrae TaxID=990691 RepID=A0ABR1SZ29_9PEZI